MATGIEIRTAQKTALYDLLTLKAEIEKENNGVLHKGLAKLINKTKATMEAEDVAYVEKMIAELS